MERNNRIKPGFTQQDIERHLQSALAAATPDIWSKLDLTVPQEKPDGGMGSGRRSSKRKRLRLGRRCGSLGAAAAACICLLAAGGGYYHYEYLQVASQVEIDVNPSLKLSLNRRERVLSAEALNADGAELVDGRSLKGKSVEQAMDQVVDSLVAKGYLQKDREKQAVLVTVSGKNEAKAQQLKAAVAANVEQTLSEKEVQAVVYDQVVQVTKELEDLAEAYQVSVGKAEFVGQLVNENDALSQDQQDAYSRMIGQTMEELTEEIDKNDYLVSSRVTIIRTEPVKSRERSVDRREERQLAEAESSAKTERPAEAEPAETERSAGPEPAAEAERPAEAEFAAEAERPAATKGHDEQSEAVAVGRGQSENAAADSGQIDRRKESDRQEKNTQQHEPQDGSAGTDQSQAENTQQHEPQDGSAGTDESQGENAGQQGGQDGRPEDGESQDRNLEDHISQSENTGNADSSENQQDHAENSGSPIEVPEETAGEPNQAGTESETEPGTESETKPETEFGLLPEGGTDHSAQAQPDAEPEMGTEADGIGQPKAEEDDDIPSESEPEVPEPSEPGEALEVPEETAPSREPEIPIGPGEFADFDEDTEDEEGSRVIHSPSKHSDTFEPGDMVSEKETGSMITSSGTQIIFEEVEKKEWKEPVYASEFLTGSERRLLQKGPGIFSENAAKEDQEAVKRFGPGFAAFSEGTGENSRIEDDFFLGYGFLGLQKRMLRGHIYR